MDVYVKHGFNFLKIDCRKGIELEVAIIYANCAEGKMMFPSMTTSVL